MKMSVTNEYVSEETRQVSSRMMQMIQEGKIQNHKLGNTSAIHHGDLEEQELGNYLRFLPTRNAYNVVQLYGQVDYEEY